MLKLKNISLSYENFQFEMDHEFESNKIHAIIGASGSGKSTLLSIIAGFYNEYQGEISWSDLELKKLEPHQRPLSFLFQEHNLFAHLTSLQNIAIGINQCLKLSDNEQELVTQAAIDVEIDDKLDQLPSELSGGQAQRVALARALARAQDQTNPRKLLLLDEPFSALDPALRSKMRDLLIKLSIKEELTILIISHNPKEMLEFADYIHLIENGNLAASYNAKSDKKMPDEIEHFINQ